MNFETHRMLKVEALKILYKGLQKATQPVISERSGEIPETIVEFRR
jgi:hypothetical protein